MEFIGKRVTSGPVLAVFTLAAVVLQFGVQMISVAHGWVSQWPFPWDQNRYFGTALVYQQLAHAEGISGIVREYVAMPPYSLTLLTTSAPFLILRDPITALYWHLLFYVGLLDLAVVYLTWRFTRSLRLGCLAVLLVHFTTGPLTFWGQTNAIGVFSGSTPGWTAASVHYELDVLVGSLTVASLAFFVNAAYSTRPRLSAVLFFLVAAAGLFARGGTMPFFVCLLSVPTVTLLVGLFRCDRRRAAWCLTAACVALAAAFLVHYGLSGRNLARYIITVQANPRWTIPSPSLIPVYHWVAATRLSWAFPVCLLAVLVFAWRERKRNLRCLTWLAARRWRQFRPAYLTLVCGWYVATIYGVPTVARNASWIWAVPLLCIIVVLGLSSLALLIGRCRHRTEEGSASRRYRVASGGVTVTLVAAMLLVSFSIAEEMQEARRVLAMRPEPPISYRDRVRGAAVLTDYMYQWARNRGREEVKYFITGKFDVFSDSENVQIRIYQHHQGHIRVAHVPLDWKPDLVFRLSDTSVGSSEPGLDDNSHVPTESPDLELARRGYWLAERVAITESRQLVVYHSIAGEAGASGRSASF